MAGDKILRSRISIFLKLFLNCGEQFEVKRQLNLINFCVLTLESSQVFRHLSIVLCDSNASTVHGDSSTTWNSAKVTLCGFLNVSSSLFLVVGIRS